MKIIGELASFIIFLVVLGIIVKIFSELFKRTSNIEPQFKHAYFKKEYLLTQNERKFFEILERIVENKYYIFPQIKLNSLLEVKKYEINAFGYRQRINRKSVDYIVCDKQYIKPLLAIELDDPTHYLYKRQERDQFVNQALNAVGLKCLRIRVENDYNFEALKSQVMQGLL